MGDKDPELSFGNIEFELPMGHPERNIQNANKNTAPLYKNRSMTGDIILEVIIIHVTLKIIGSDEFAQCEHEEREAQCIEMEL